MLPLAKNLLREAHSEISEIRDSVILGKRLILARQNSGRTPSDEEVAALQQKFEQYEETLSRWVERFAEHGIILRDLDAGLVDFPYRAESNGQEYFLCWRMPEDGIFYFHGPNEGYAGRHPITLLPA